jgi:hypothetical protein
MDSFTATDGNNETELRHYTTVSFIGMERIAQPVISLSSICILFYVVFHKLKLASPLESGIVLLARVH